MNVGRIGVYRLKYLLTRSEKLTEPSSCKIMRLAVVHLSYILDLALTLEPRLKPPLLLSIQLFLSPRLPPPSFFLPL